MNSCYSLQERMQGLHCIKTIAVLTAGPIDTIRRKEYGKTRSHSLLGDIKSGRYACVPANGMLDRQEKLYAVLNMSYDMAKTLCGHYQRTAFVFSKMMDDGSIFSEFWEKENIGIPYHKRSNGYVMKEKGNGEEMPVINDASDNLVVTGKHFQYKIPFGEIERGDCLFSDNVKHMIEVAKRKWNGKENEDSILNHTINGVGVSPYLWRKAVIKGFYDD